MYGDPMTAKRIDFKHVRAGADFAAVLAAYGLELKKDGSKPSQFKALCPFHEDSRPSLKVNTDRNLFHCFACGAKGNVIEFVMAREGLEIRPAAEKVAALSGIAPHPGGPIVPLPARNAPPPPAPPPAAPETPEEPADEALDGELYNPPLTFELKLGQPTELMSWLAGRGIDAATVDTFGLGLVSKKSRTIGGRLAIPLHDERGRLLGYCGRHVGDDVPDDTPKYVLPKGFRKDFEVFNLHRVAVDPADPRPLVVIFE